MSLLHQGIEEKKLDLRVLEKNLSRGAITADEVAKSSKELPDDAENAGTIDVDALLQETLQSRPVQARRG